MINLSASWCLLAVYLVVRSWAEFPTYLRLSKEDPAILRMWENR